MKIRRCPNCGAEHDETIQQCGCGHKWQTKGQAPDDPYRRLCAYHANGQRCHYLGTFSPNTLGGGPYYCRGHDGDVSPAMGAQIVAQSRREHPEPGWWSIDLLRRQVEQEAEVQAQAYLLAHGLEKLPFEDEYAARLRDYCKTLGMPIKRMPT